MFLYGTTNKRTTNISECIILSWDFGLITLSHSNHPFHDNSDQISCSCCCHKSNLLYSHHDHHGHLRPRVHHSLLLPHHRGSLEYSIFCLGNFDRCIFDLIFTLLVFKQTSGEEHFYLVLVHMEHLLHMEALVHIAPQKAMVGRPEQNNTSARA